MAEEQARYLRGLYRLSKHMRTETYQRVNWAVEMFNEHYYNKTDVDVVNVVGVVDAQAYLIRYSKSETER
jgi:hypothetical protein